MVVRFFIVSPGRTNGPSMEPIFIDNDLVYVDKFSFFVRKPRRYDIVQLADVENNKLLIKRVIGLPGEVVVIKRGKIFIQKKGSRIEEKLDESDYLKKNTYTTFLGQVGTKRVLVEEDHYYVVGDNRSNSVDSRNYGTIHRASILGRVFKIGSKK